MSKTLDNSDDKTDSKRRDAHPSVPPGIDVNVSDLMTQSEVIQFLRIPEISNSKDNYSVIENLKGFKGYPESISAGRHCTPKKLFGSGWKNN